MDKRELGRRYELFAADYLKKQGYRIKMKYPEFEDIYREGLRTIKCEKN